MLGFVLFVVWMWPAVRSNAATSSELEQSIKAVSYTHLVIAVHEDGKLDLSIRDKSYRIIETDAVKVMELIESFDGVLPFNDKASPEVIKRETQMSKNEFKRAVGHLLKNGRIEITEKSIRKIQ